MSVRMIKVSDCKCIYSSRKNAKDDLELMESIRLLGIKEPIIVQQRRENYFVLDGSRRLDVAKALGLEEIAAFVISDKD